MAHLSLPNSEMHEGVRFDEHRRVRELAAAGAVVLFPSAGALDAASLRDQPPHHLIVLDGTWSEAGKLLARNPLLRNLPRIGVRRAQPGRYRIRREPAAHCLATIEAVVEVLGALCGDPARFLPALRAFDHMVEAQLRYAARARARSGEPQAERVRGQLRTPARAQAIHQPAHAILHRGGAEMHVGPDFAVGRPGRDEPQDRLVDVVEL